jgi:hypothetical protein
MLMHLLGIRILRRKDDVYCREFKIMQTTAVVVSVILLIAVRGDADYLAAPLVALALSVQLCSQWFLKENPDPPNIISFYLSGIPVSVVITVLAFLPPYAVAIPGLLLSKSPVLYSAWCGLGYPLLSFVLRLFMLAYFTNQALQQVKDGRMSPDGVVPWISSISFSIAMSLMFGDTMLLFMSENVKFATASSTLAILTEVAGKIYAATVIVHKSKLERKLRKKAGKVANLATGGRILGDSSDAAGGATADEEAAATAAEEKKRLDEQMAMFAVRLSNEIVAEKVCIVVSAFTNAFLIKSPHSVETIAMYAAIFFSTELVADALLVHVLVEYYDVPMLRLPREKFDWFSGDFWSAFFEIALMPVGGALYFLHAYGAGLEWITVDGVVGALGNSTNATLSELN